MPSLKTQKTMIKGMIAKAPALELELVWLPRIIERQTRDEVHDEQTEERNGMGLTGADAPFITSVYKHVQDGQHLTPLMASSVRKILSKYWKQYAQEMN